MDVSGAILACGADVSGRFALRTSDFKPKIKINQALSTYLSTQKRCRVDGLGIGSLGMPWWAYGVVACLAVQPLPESQELFFDLLPSTYPFAVPSLKPLDPVAARLSQACGSLEGLLALAIASSELHSFNVKLDGSYDLSLPDFELPPERKSLLLQTCHEMLRLYALVASQLLFQELCADCPQTSSCQASIEDSSSRLDLDDVRRRALSRMSRASCLASDLETARLQHQHAAQEVRIFLDHAFQSVSVNYGLPGLPPLAEFLREPPSFRHVPVAGQRWDVLLHILSQFSQEDRVRGLRVVEVGVEKGMTITYLMRHEAAIAEYVAVDPWHLPGKSMESNEVLESYHSNLKAWAEGQPSFQRHGRPAVRIIREPSEAAAALLPLNHFDLVFIDAEHSFEAAQRDIQVWKRRLRPGGVLAGHDFSLFHPAVCLAVLLECGPFGADLERFPLRTEEQRPLVYLSSDSVWWTVRA